MGDRTKKDVRAPCSESDFVEATTQTEPKLNAAASIPSSPINNIVRPSRHGKLLLSNWRGPEPAR
jgi:hypothetical protein